MAPVACEPQHAATGGDHADNEAGSGLDGAASMMETREHEIDTHQDTAPEASLAQSHPIAPSSAISGGEECANKLSVAQAGVYRAKLSSCEARELDQSSGVRPICALQTSQ